MNHTPGPWLTSATPNIGCPAVTDKDGWMICARVESADDARLIAAAPDLLAALEAADKWVAMYHELPGHDAASKCMTAVIRSAIAKAIGGAA